MKTLPIMLALCCAMPFAYAQKNPFDVQPFKLPEEYQGKLKDYRKTWQRLTGFEYSGLHWNQFIVVYMNKGHESYRHNYTEYLRYYQDYDEDEEDEDEVEEPSFKSYKPGTIVLKENFTGNQGAPDTPISVTLMIKEAKGYDPKGGDWKYVQFAPNGEIIMQGNSQDPAINKACASCHINISDRDYIFANFFSKSN